LKVWWKERTKELAQANENLLNANKELQRSNAQLEEFAYAASHDLKEPIRKIHFFSDLLKQSLKNKITDIETGFFVRLESASKRMSSLIDDLLAYSQVSLRPEKFETVDMEQVIDLVLNDLDLEIEQKRAQIKVGKCAVFMVTTVNCNKRFITSLPML
jgi:light-regulated signal transduction histidine kinase (bacteriophytochrome)